MTGIGTAEADVVKPKKLSSPTIRAAVDVARRKAAPAAVAAAKAEAQRLAAASGLTLLGDVLNVAEQPATPFGPFYGVDGTFGPGKYCGTIRTPIFKRNSKGRRVFTHKFRSHFGCRVPPEVVLTVAVTFAAQ